MRNNFQRLWLDWQSQSWSEEDRLEYAQDRRLDEEEYRQSNIRQVKRASDKILDIMGLKGQLCWNMETGKISYRSLDLTWVAFNDLLYDFWTEAA